MSKKRKRFNQSTILAYFMAECKKCGSKENLTTHHKNSNPTDDSLKNLQILCLSCHRKVEGVFYKKKHFR